MGSPNYSTILRATRAERKLILGAQSARPMPGNLPEDLEIHRRPNQQFIIEQVLLVGLPRKKSGRTATLQNYPGR